jgi:hypothetical protein
MVFSLVCVFSTYVLCVPSTVSIVF